MTVDALACRDMGRDKMICVLSASSNERTICRLRAVLQTNSKVRMNLASLMPRPFYRYGYTPVRCDGGYTIHRTRLDFNTWHVLAVAKADGLLPVLSDESLWQELSSDRYTTPILKAWVPWLREQLLTDGHLVKLDCFQCNSAWLNVNTEALDDYVSEGVRLGALEVK